MSFRESAIRAHYEVKEEEQAHAANFAIRALKSFRRSFTQEYIISDAISPRVALLKIDDVEIEARESCGGIEFFVVTVCSECGENNTVHTPTLADIGKALENDPPACKHCDI